MLWCVISEIIGEAATQRPPEFKTQHFEVPWSRISGLRNRIGHDYAGIDLPLVWRIVTGAIPELALQLPNLK